MKTHSYIHRKSYLPIDHLDVFFISISSLTFLHTLWTSAEIFQLNSMKIIHEHSSLWHSLFIHNFDNYLIGNWTFSRSTMIQEHKRPMKRLWNMIKAKFQYSSLTYRAIVRVWEAFYETIQSIRQIFEYSIGFHRNYFDWLTWLVGDYHQYRMRICTSPFPVVKAAWKSENLSSLLICVWNRFLHEKILLTWILLSNQNFLCRLICVVLLLSLIQ